MTEPTANRRDFSTSQLAKILDVSTRTIYRWIEEEKINYLRTGTGRFRFTEEELKRIQSDRKEHNLENIEIELLKTIRNKKIVYLRELQVTLEDFFWQEDVKDVAEKLAETGQLSTEFFDSNRWYFPSSTLWEDVRALAESKKRLMTIYINHRRNYCRRGVIYDDYSEMLIEDALIKTGYCVVSKNSHYFNGKEYHQGEEERPGRKKDLDYIAYAKKKDKYIGIQIKNRLEAPRLDDIHQMIDICRTLDLVPILVTRLSHPKIYDIVRTAGGTVFQFKRYLLQPPFDREAFKNIIEMLNIPLGVYQWVPEFMIRNFTDLLEEL